MLYVHQVKLEERNEICFFLFNTNYLKYFFDFQTLLGKILSKI